MMERSRSSPDIIGILQRDIAALQSTVSVLEHRDHSIPDWITLTLTSGWVPYLTGDPINPPLQYWRDSAGIVRLRGIIKNGTLYPNVLGTLPVGFRPKAVMRYAVPSASLFGYAQVDDFGQIILVVGSNTWVDFAGVSFRAEQ